MHSYICNSAQHLTSGIPIITIIFHDVKGRFYFFIFTNESTMAYRSSWIYLKLTLLERDLKL